MSEAKYKKGDRIELHPGTDQWMMGDRFGEVVEEPDSDGRYRVRMDKSKRKLRVSEEHILKKVT